MNNDHYLNVTNSDVYHKVTGAWVFITNIKGATGNTGAIGNQGTTGTAGTNGTDGKGYNITSTTAHTLDIGSKAFVANTANNNYLVDDSTYTITSCYLISTCTTINSNTRSWSNSCLTYICLGN